MSRELDCYQRCGLLFCGRFQASRIPLVVSIPDNVTSEAPMIAYTSATRNVRGNLVGVTIINHAEVTDYGLISQSLTNPYHGRHSSIEDEIWHCTQRGNLARRIQPFLFHNWYNSQYIADILGQE